MQCGWSPIGPMGGGGSQWMEDVSIYDRGWVRHRGAGPGVGQQG